MTVRAIILSLTFLIAFMTSLCRCGNSIQCFKDECERTRNRQFETVIDFKNNNLSFIPSNSTYKGNSVWFKYYGFEVVTRENFVAHDVEHIMRMNLSSNDINRIEPQAFKVLHCLKYLNLSRNLVRNIDNQTFAGLHNLEELDLSNNRIEALVEANFKDLGMLKTLNLANNHLSYLGPHAFSDMTNLDALSLSGNRIRKILHSRAFDGLFHLRLLDLDRNWLSLITIQIFRELHSLEVLNLAQNQISLFLLSDHHQDFSHLMLLNVSFNTITDLDPRDFKSRFPKDKLILDLNENMFRCSAIEEMLAKFSRLNITVIPGTTFHGDQRQHYSCDSEEKDDTVKYKDEESEILKKLERQNITTTTTTTTTETPSIDIEGHLPDYLQEAQDNQNNEILLLVIALGTVSYAIFISIEYFCSCGWLRRCVRRPRSSNTSASPSSSPSEAPGESIPLQVREPPQAEEN